MRVFIVEIFLPYFYTQVAVFFSIAELKEIVRC